MGTLKTKTTLSASELRIGNWVEANSPMMQVAVIGKYNIELYMPGSEADTFNFDPNEVNPIPLSPDILLRCNAIEDNYGLFYLRRDGSNKSESGMDVLLTLKKCLIGGEVDWVWDCSVGDFDNSINLCYIKHLHQLQNLVHSITGTEITINL